MNSNNHTKPIIAAVLLEPSDRFIVEAGRFLAKKLHAPLRLVHALRPLFSYVGAGDIVVNPYYGYETTYTDDEEKKARNKLEAMLLEINDLEATADIVRDFPTEAILSYAHEQNAGLILCGVRSEQRDNRRFLSGLSTGFTLASDADMPVLLVPLSKSIPFEDSLRILVADNFEREGEQALVAGLWLAQALYAQRLTHVHVHATTYGEIDKMIAAVREAMVLGQIPSDPLLNRDYYIERVKDMTREELIRRCNGSRVKALNSTIYEPAVGFGEPAEIIHAEVLRSNSQLMVFGRHHLIRRKTLSLGRIPYHAMIEEGIATLIIPDSQKAVRTFMGAEYLKD